MSAKQTVFRMQVLLRSAQRAQLLSVYRRAARRPFLSGHQALAAVRFQRLLHQDMFLSHPIQQDLSHGRQRM